MPTVTQLFCRTKLPPAAQSEERYPSISIGLDEKGPAEELALLVCKSIGLDEKRGATDVCHIAFKSPRRASCTSLLGPLPPSSLRIDDATVGEIEDSSMFFSSAIILADDDANVIRLLVFKVVYGMGFDKKKVLR